MSKGTTVQGINGGKLTLVNVAECEAAEWNARRAMDADAIEGLRASIAEDGLLQPILLQETKGAKYKVICGARRLVAVRALKWEKVPAVILEVDDKTARMMNVVENIQREGLTPMEEGEAFVRMVREDGMDPREIAVMIGKEHNLPYVYQRMQLTRLGGGTRKLLDEGKLPLGAAIHLARLTDEDRNAFLKAYRERKKMYAVDEVEMLRTEAVKEWIESELYLRLKGVAFDLSDTTLPGGACLECPKRTGSQAILFADLMADGEDRCTDRACFTKKIEAVIERETTANPSLVKLSTSYVLDGGKWKGEKPVLAHKWREDKRGGAEGIIVDDSSMTRLGQKVRLAVLQDDGDDRRQAGMDAAQKKEAEKIRHRREVRMRVLKAVVQEMADEGMLLRNDYPTAARAVIGRLDNDARRVFCKALGLEVKKSTVGGMPDYAKAMEVWATDKKRSDMGVIVALAMAAHGAVHPFDGTRKKDDPLFQVAEAHGIKVGVIEGEVEQGGKKKGGVGKASKKDAVEKKGKAAARGAKSRQPS